MYTDPSLIREHIVKLRLNEQESQLVEALVNYTGQEKAPLLRTLLLEQARMVLAGQADYRPSQREYEGAEPALIGAF